MAEPSKNQSELARQWIDRLCAGPGLEGAWRLQLIDQRTRVVGTSSPDGWLVDASSENYVDRDGTVIAPVAGTSVSADGTVSTGGTAVKAFDSDRPMRIRRFAKGIPASCVDEAIRHLISLAPYSGITFNGTPIAGVYVPTHTWWEREDRDTVDRGKYVDNVYTLFQDLREANSSDSADIGPSGCSCTEETTMRYEYDSFSVEAAQCLGQGYSTSIQSVSRNEDGTFDYAVVTRHALTQMSGPVTVKCDVAEQVEETTWRNAYGSPGSWTDHAGNPIAVPSPCSRASGVTYDVSSRENDDCTFDVTVRKTTAKPVNPASRRTTATIYQRDLEVGRTAQSSRPSDVTGASGGVVQTAEFKTRPDGKYDTTERTLTETPVESASVKRAKYLDGVVLETVSRNQTPSFGNSALRRNLKPGESVEVRKTDGGLRDVTVVEADVSDVGGTGDDCRETLFQHEHTEFSNVASKPSPVHVPAAAGGVVHRQSARETDRGTYNVADETVTELPVQQAVVERQRTLDGEVVQTTHRNQPKADGSAARSRQLRPGESVTVRKTDGDLCDIVTSEVSPTPVGVKANEHRETQFHEEDVETSNVPVVPPGFLDAPPYGGGLVPRRSVRLTDRGTYDITTDDTRERPVPSAVVEKSMTLDALVVQTTDRNQASPDGHEPARPGESVKVEKTDGGLYNVTYTATEPQETGKIAEQCMLNALEHRTTTERGSGNGDEPYGYSEHAPEVDTTQRTWNEVKYERQQSGNWRTTEVEHRHIRHEWDAEVCMELCYSYDVWFRNDTYDEYHELLRSLTTFIADAAKAWTRDKRPPSSFSCSPDIHINEANLYDGHIAVRAVWAAGSAGMTGETEGILAYVEYHGSFHRGFQAMGRGRETLDRLLNTTSTVSNSQDDPKRALTHNASFDYNPDSNTWTCHVNVSMSHVNNNTANPLELPALSGGGNREIFVEDIAVPAAPAGKPSLTL